MSEQQQVQAQAPGTPNIVVNTGLKPEAIKLDTNRINQATETKWEWLQDLALPATLAELNLQVLSYILGSATLISVLRLLVPVVPQLAIPIALMLIAGFLCSAYAAQKIPESRFFVGYRLFWFAIGVCLAYHQELIQLLKG